jgi:EAL domain-containing protein (putative c-di-GMP-specific phosphodiesterase class I)
MATATKKGVATVISGLEIVLQPIVELATGVTLAVEALARFHHAPNTPVDAVIAQAHVAGFGYTLEAACLRAALDRRAELPDGVQLAVNLSPDVMRHPVITRAWPADLDGVIVEVTEHHASDPPAVRDQFTHLRSRGAAIAVDDVGTGYAGLLRLATMRPDYVKVAQTVVTGVRDSAAQSAVLEALVTFSHRLGAAVIGEGVEAIDDLTALTDFDVDYAQGWAIGRPAAAPTPISDAVVATCRRTRGHVLQRHAALGLATANTQGMHAVTLALTNASDMRELQAALGRAATQLGIDAIGVSTMNAEGGLTEIASSATVLDSSVYDIADYPATRAVLDTGGTAEIHLDDPGADPAEKELLRRLDNASLLMTPVVASGRPIGVLELAHRSHHRWTTGDIAHARGLATHVAQALMRISALHV